MSNMAIEQQVNLYQPILRAEKRLFSAARIAVGLTVLLICLAGLAAFGAWRTTRIERAVAGLQEQETRQIALAASASATLRPTRSLAELDAEAKVVSADIAARERALEILREGASAPASGFAARLEALARQGLEGLWLTHIVVGSGDGRLAMRGSTTDPHLVPAYLAKLASDAALIGVRFDKLAMRRALPQEAPAQLIFELDAPGITLPPSEPAK
jgi:hypothetical protein